MFKKISDKIWGFMDKPNPKIDLINLAEKVYKVGYYTEEDRIKFLKANKIYE